MDSGDLVPDQLVIDMVIDRLERPDAQRGALLDGFPRTRAQAEVVDEMLAARNSSIRTAIYLDVPVPVLVERIAGRWLCPSCQASYPGRSTAARQWHLYGVPRSPLPAVRQPTGCRPASDRGLPECDTPGHRPLCRARSAGQDRRGPRRVDRACIAVRQPRRCGARSSARAVAPVRQPSTSGRDQSVHLARSYAVRSPREQRLRPRRRLRGRVPLPSVSRVPRGDQGQGGRNLARRPAALLIPSAAAIQVCVFI